MNLGTLYFQEEHLNHDLPSKIPSFNQTLMIYPDNQKLHLYLNLVREF